MESGDAILDKPKDVESPTKPLQLKGRPIQAVKINDDDHTYTLDEKALNDILDDDRVRDKPICVVSVAG